ncbi:hypothetical protein GCM10022384_10480 [Streptomyces marokkonensis]|uniref:Uncharacterized protein n=1 Tax=Streptomyces marokkonensis TaxID=324855 RepID=A0ABP7P5G3_9ACTN
MLGAEPGRAGPREPFVGADHRSGGGYLSVPVQLPAHAEVHGEVSLSLYVRTVRTIVRGAGWSRVRRPRLTSTFPAFTTERPLRMEWIRRT